MQINFKNGSTIKPIKSKDTVRGKRREIISFYEKCSCGNRLKTVYELSHLICNDCYIKLSKSDWRSVCVIKIAILIEGWEDADAWEMKNALKEY